MGVAGYAEAGGARGPGGFDPLPKGGEARDHGGERGDGLGITDDQREGAEQVGEGHRRLGDHTELDLAADEERGHDERRDDLIEVVVAKDPGSLTPEQLRAEVWQVVEPKYLARLAQLTEDHQTAAARGMAASNLDDVAQAAASERIGMLLIEADRVIPGRFDPATGEVRPDRLAHPDVDDLIDDLAEAVLRTGGEVVVVPAGRMPTDTGLAATFRH